MVINGIKNIAHYLGISEPTACKYIKECGLPVRKLFNAAGSPVFSTSKLLDEWIEESLYNPGNNGNNRNG